MSITMERPTTESLDEVVEAVAGWQHEGGPVQLHAGDLGWHRRFGDAVLAEALRVWRRDGEVLAAGMVDGPTLVRMALSPRVDQDEAFAEALVRDLEDRGSGVLAGEAGAAEVRYGAALRARLRAHGWASDEPWTPLVRDLTEDVEDCGLRVEVVDEAHVAARVAVQRAAFPRSTFTAEQWHSMAAASPYERARCLVGYDAQGHAVAGVTVWSAGEGRPGLLEPMGVHRDHRGHGYGTAITVAAAAALQELGSSSATVCTASSNVGGVATYAAAGYQPFPDVTDFRRPSDRTGTAA